MPQPVGLGVRRTSFFAVTRQFVAREYRPRTVLPLRFDQERPAASLSGLPEGVAKRAVRIRKNEDQGIAVAVTRGYDTRARRTTSATVTGA